MKKLATEKILEAYGSKDRIPKNFRMPFRKGADKEEYADLDVECFVTLKSAKRRPVVFDAAKNVIESETDFYGGCWARATVVCYVYTPSGKKKFAPGVAFGLQNIQKIEDDEPLGGGVMQGGGEDDFEVIEGSSEDSEAYTDENDLFG
ncbi:MAG: DUF2815 family protein [Deltaproteobacteria bacterium]|nr:DUF2815 family protein [Deltaproteobacteria bacterium]